MKHIIILTTLILFTCIAAIMILASCEGSRSIPTVYKATIDSEDVGFPFSGADKEKVDKYAEFDASGRYIRNIYHIENDMLPILRVTVTDITKGERTMFSSDEIDISYISSDGISYSLDKDDESNDVPCFLMINKEDRDIISMEIRCATLVPDSGEGMPVSIDYGKIEAVLRHHTITR